MDLTPAERIIIANQYKILEHLDKKNADHYQLLGKAVEEGFAWGIDDDYQGYENEHAVSRDLCTEVTDILSMFSSLNHHYNELADNNGVDARWLKFKGFDNSGEGGQLMFCEYLVNDKRRFTDLDFSDIHGFDSHSPQIDGYRRMLAEFKASDAKLTKDDIIRITNAAIHPTMRGKV